MEKRQILLIDDEINKRDVFLNALEKMPTMFKCSFAKNTSDASNAIKCIKKIIPDFIFVDVSKQDQNYVHCVEAIKNEKGIGHIPLYLYSCDLNVQSTRRASKMGVLKCIKKPKDIRTLTKFFKVLFYESMRAEIRNYAPRKNELM